MDADLLGAKSFAFDPLGERPRRPRSTRWPFTLTAKGRGTVCPLARIIGVALVRCQPKASILPRSNRAPSKNEVFLMVFQSTMIGKKDVFWRGPLLLQRYANRDSRGQHRGGDRSQYPGRYGHWPGAVPPPRSMAVLYARDGAAGALVLAAPRAERLAKKHLFPYYSALKFHKKHLVFKALRQSCCECRRLCRCIK
jgi:hypothetical protein